MDCALSGSCSSRTSVYWLPKSQRWLTKTALDVSTRGEVPLPAELSFISEKDATSDLKVRILLLDGRKREALREIFSEVPSILASKDDDLDYGDILDDIGNQFENLVEEAHPRVQEALKREYHYIFREGLKYPDLPHIKLNTIGKDPFEVKGINVIPIEVLHYKLPVLGFRIGDFTYVTDASTISKEEKKKIKGSKVLVLNALRKEKHISHFTLDEAVALMEELKPEQGYLIHMSHQIGFHEQLNQSLPKNVQLAYDGQELEI